MDTLSKTQPVHTELQANQGMKVWWKLLRPHTLTAGFIPVMIGAAYAFSTSKQSFSFLLFVAMLVATILIQSATNMFNEYYDYKRGLDDASSVGIGGTIVRDGVKPQTVLNLAFVFYGLSILLGIYICMQSSWIIALVGLICLAAGYLYTGGPYPIAYTPFGELTAGIFMGIILINISYFIQAGNITTQSISLALPASFTIAAILLANNIRDRVNDEENGRKTIAILLGHRGAIIFLASLFAGAMVTTMILVLTNTASILILLSLLSTPIAVRAIKIFHHGKTNIEMIPGMGATAKFNTIFGFLFCIGLIISLFI